MAVSWRRTHLPSLESQTWVGLRDEWLVKTLFQEDSYDVLVTDLTSVWRETLDEREIARRSKSLNPNLEAPIPVILSGLSCHLTPSSTSAYVSLSEDRTGLTLTLSFSLSRLPYQWEFKCRQVYPEMLSTHLVSPLLSIVGELARRQQELVRILREKDREIQDYKDNGATVSRRHLQTKPFDELAFTNDMTHSTDFEHSCELPLQALMDTSCQELYRNVTMVRMWQARKDDLPPMDTSAEAEPSTTGTWVGKLPASLLPTLPPSHSHSSPTSSHVKRPDVVSPSKEDEHIRRVELERKLEEDRVKAKRKKRKLM